MDAFLKQAAGSVIEEAAEKYLRGMLELLK